MNNWKKVIVLSGLCSCALSVNAMASTNLETGSSLAGISVALNNYYAGNTEPEKQLASSYSNIQNKSAQSNSIGRTIDVLRYPDISERTLWKQ